MLHALSIRNILLIDQLDLEFQQGLNVLTGETGAGKSILLDSLGMVLGWRGKADIVRTGAEQGEVTAEFSLTPDHPAHAVLAEAGLPDDDTLILRRINSADGRKRAFVNDRACSGEILRQLSDVLVEIHGQHDDKGLLDVKAHRALLDAFAGAEADLTTTRAAWRSLAESRKVLAKAESDLAAAAADADFLRHAVVELDQLSPEAGEDATLDTRRRLMQASERIREDIAKAAGAISDDGADGAITDAIRWLEDASDKAEGRLEAPIAALGRALSELADAQRGIEDTLEQLDFNPLDLEQVEERLFAIRALARKHGVQPDDLAEKADELRAKLTKIDTGASHIAELKAEVKRHEDDYQSVALKLSGKRTKAAAKLDTAMAKELPPLKMDAAVFTTVVEATDAGPDGVDSVAFTVSTNPGAPSGPIDKIASGGELSRFLLALKVCLTSRSAGLTMIFDEIDRGVGGATADAVGRRLHGLAEGGQVLVVTHSPQVAAKGGHHWKVAKAVVKGVTTTRVEPLETAERIDEIARMLAGDSITPEARSAAEVLLKA